MPPRPDVTATEVAILDILWDAETASVREISERLYGENTPSKHAGVKSLLDRLAEKGYVERDTSGFAHLFQATIDRASFVGMKVEQLAETHFGGSLAPMLLSLVDRLTLSNRDRAAIQKILDKADRSGE